MSPAAVSRAEVSGAPFRALHVCTGNVCRSPMAEALMRSGLRSRLGEGARRFVVESAGTWGHSGSPMDPNALSALGALGLDGLGPDGQVFRARELVAEHVAAADLVLCATRAHRAEVVVLQPDAAARTFTVRELGRLCAAVDPAALPSGDPVVRARALVAQVTALREAAPPVSLRDDDLADPYHAPRTDFAACAVLVRAALAGPLDLVAGAVRA